MEDIILLRPDGSHLQNLTQGTMPITMGISSLSWLGERLLALHAEGAGNSGQHPVCFPFRRQETTVLAYPLSTSTQMVLSPDQRNPPDRGSANGQDTVSVMQADGSTRASWPASARAGWSMGWSPDGQWIVFSVFPLQSP